MTGEAVCLRVAQLDSVELARLLAGQLEELADANALWYLGEWGSGRRPPESARSAGVVWRPDEPSTAVTFVNAPILFAEAVGSCGSIAAADLGALRARRLAEGVPLERLRVVAPIHLRATADRYWHAGYRVQGRLVDPTKGMKQWPAS